MSIQNQQLAEHFYRETAGRLSGYFAQAFRNQASEVLPHIFSVLNEYGPAETSSMLHGLIEFNENYPGGEENIWLGDVFEAVSELRTAGLEPGSQEYKEQMEHMAESNLFSQSDATGQAAPSQQQLAAASLNEALAYQKQKLGRAAGEFQNDNEVKSIERIIERIEADLQSLNQSAVPAASAPDNPQLSPEAQARQDQANADVRAGIAAHDQRMASFDDDVVSNESWEADAYGTE